MKIALPLAALVLAAPFANAQGGVTGTFRADDVGFAPWIFNLTAKGATLTGTISQSGAGTSLTSPTAIYDGAVDGKSLSFKCEGPGGGKIIIFSGVLNRDVITFDRTVQMQAGGDLGLNGIYGASGASHFTARRVQGAAAANLARRRCGPCAASCRPTGRLPWNRHAQPRSYPFRPRCCGCCRTSRVSRRRRPLSRPPRARSFRPHANRGPPPCRAELPLPDSLTFRSHPRLSRSHLHARRDRSRQATHCLRTQRHERHDRSPHGRLGRKIWTSVPTVSNTATPKLTKSMSRR